MRGGTSFPSVDSKRGRGRQAIAGKAYRLDEEDDVRCKQDGSEVVGRCSELAGAASGAMRREMGGMGGEGRGGERGEADVMWWRL